MNYVLVALGMLLCLYSTAQQATDSSLTPDRKVPEKVFRQIDCDSRSASQRMQKQRNLYLQRLQRRENKIKTLLQQRDSSLAKNLFADTDSIYARLAASTGKADVFHSVYSSRLDSLSTSLRFLQQSGIAKLPAASVTQSLNNLQQVQQQLNSAEQTQQYLQQRQQLLQQSLQQLGMVKELQSFSKECTYYRAQLQEYKTMLEQPQQLEQKLLQTVRTLPAFRNFFAQHSQLGSLFALPVDNTATTVLPAGLQTREMVNQQLINQFGSLQAVNQALQQNTPPATNLLQQARSNINQYASGSAGNTAAAMPEVNTNSQHTKSFLQRLTLGLNIQTQKAAYYFPVTTDLAATVGYRLNDKLVMGMGVGGKIGWGTGWSHIALSAQGSSLRSFADLKLKGSWWATAGYECNYRILSDSLADLHTGQVQHWYPSGLAGISKIISLKSKTWKRTKIQLLWDFLSYQQRPQTPAILWRVEYAFK